jgi:hypothetical protein
MAHGRSVRPNASLTPEGRPRFLFQTCADRRKSGSSPLALFQFVRDQRRMEAQAHSDDFDAGPGPDDWTPSTLSDMIKP